MAMTKTYSIKEVVIYPNGDKEKKQTNKLFRTYEEARNEMIEIVKNLLEKLCWNTDLATPTKARSESYVIDTGTIKFEFEIVEKTFLGEELFD